VPEETDLIGNIASTRDTFGLEGKQMLLSPPNTAMRYIHSGLHP